MHEFASDCGQFRSFIALLGVVNEVLPHTTPGGAATSGSQLVLSRKCFYYRILAVWPLPTSNLHDREDIAFLSERRLARLVRKPTHCSIDAAAVWLCKPAASGVSVSLGATYFLLHHSILHLICDGSEIFPGCVVRSGKITVRNTAI